MKRFIQSVWTVSGVFLFALSGMAGVDSGNTLALDIATTKSENLKKQYIKNAMHNLYYFRYLKITEMSEGETNGTKYVTIKTVEPSSDFIIEFTVLKPVSLKRLLEESPKTEVGHAIGVQGRIWSIEKKGEENVMVLNPVIVKHKDKLAPTRGKELATELYKDSRSGTTIGPDGKPIVEK